MKKTIFCNVQIDTKTACFFCPILTPKKWRIFSENFLKISWKKNVQKVKNPPRAFSETKKTRFLGKILSKIGFSTSKIPGKSAKISRKISNSERKIFTNHKPRLPFWKLPSNFWPPKMVQNDQKSGFRNFKFCQKFSKNFIIDTKIFQKLIQKNVIKIFKKIMKRTSWSENQVFKNRPKF